MSVRPEGFSLAEVLVALALLGIVSVGAGRLLLTEQRSYREIGQRADLADNLRAAADILAADLWSLDAVDGDILALGPDSIRVRGERRFAVVCQALGGASLTFRGSLTFGVRDFRPGDSILVYVPGDSVWSAGAVTAGPAAAACPDSAPGERIDVSLPGPAPSAGTPVRGFEIVTYRLYRASDGAYYLGVRDAGGLQPLAGPLTADGLRLGFMDSAGAFTADPRATSAIRIRVRALSAEPVFRRGRSVTLDDSVVAWVTLRNNRRGSGP